MILVTGATGFVGRHLVPRLTIDAGLSVRVLLRPGSDVNRLPRPLTVHTVVGEITDANTLLAAMDGIHTVIHLVGTETRGRHARLNEVDVEGTKVVIEAALAACVGRIIYVSRLGAEKASAFPVLRAKGEIEERIRDSGLAYTIFRSGVLFGKGDRFSEHIGMLARTFPFYMVPGDGEVVFQPLWVDDLVTCLVMSLENFDLIDTITSIGGPEFLTYRRLVMRVMHTINSRRPIIGVPMLAHRSLTWFLDGLFARWPLTEQWTEMLSTTQTAEMGSIERYFGFRPTAFDVGLLSTYMKRRFYALELIHYALTNHW
ncbi:MAG: NAD(P)H-binding protein [Anaerolineae bacterium]|nr:NAD(P)H-binding protein [Anaerolineae bacterium]